eukprot:CAMPEP_0170588940 /NCGR_PEP_ID=MMETSP0224-20130122/11095_1 /TAXON_ID=285029 /ORGANISM="Togula jolla, Strain CCCM 725" /LENGTH=392 /DNA_ID=CAMNT_0010912685 /DNA_START=69 /DNA_END=1247 /DNA_ORIENTATION=-
MAPLALLVFVLACGPAQALLATQREGRSTSVSFEDFVSNFSVGYELSSPEYELRKELFQRRLALIEEHNARPGMLWKAGVNHLIDRTPEEFSRLHGLRGIRHNSAPAVALVATDVQSGPASPKEEVSWTHLGAMQEPVSQGSCGSCWAMATSVMLDARHEVLAGSRRTFSAQQLVDCVPNPRECGGSGGCKGATVELALEYAMANGLKDTSAYPYEGSQGDCPSEDVSLSQGKWALQGRSSVVLGLSGYATLPSNQARPLMENLVQGPVAISVAASSWMLYSSGIFDDCEKDAVVNHAVVLVGYGKDGGHNYWNVQNSWGKSWGEEGRIRIFRHGTPEEDTDYCGTDHKPEDGIECKPYRDSVTVCGMCGILFDSVAAHFGPRSSSVLRGGH